MCCYCRCTVLEPPVPCGTRINCTHPCNRDSPACGHPRSPHSCHKDPMPCPPCVILTSKRCACWKKNVDNVRCALEQVLCGTTCRKLLSCGFHHCEQLCHSNGCGECTAVCVKPCKLWCAFLCLSHLVYLSPHTPLHAHIPA